MNARYLLGIALVVGAAVAACGAPDQGSLNSGGDDEGGGTGTQDGNKPAGSKPGSKPTGTETPVPGAPATPGNLPTNSAAGKDYFAKNVQPILEAKCSGCHIAGGAGTPTFILKGDAAKTYEMIYAQGFAGATSRITVKGVHSGGSAPALTGAEIGAWKAWVQVESTNGGKPTQASVLEKFGGCFDKAKFDAINFGQLRTTRRQTGNNPQNLNENANTCTGCDNAPCRTCHSADDVTGFVMAIGNPILPPEYTFEESKKMNPQFIQKYVSTTPTGEPQFNPGVKTKSIATIEKAKTYEHPMYKMSPAMDAAIQAFVDDAITKFKAGTCGK